MSKDNHIDRRTFIKYFGLATGGLVLAACSGQPAAPQDKKAAPAAPEKKEDKKEPEKKAAYPEPGRPIRHLCHQKAGGFVSLITQKMIPIVSKNLGGTPLNYEEQTGAGGRIAFTTVYNAKPDGYTTVTGAPSDAILGELLHGAKYKTRELTWIHAWVNLPWTLNVKKNGPYKTLDDLIKAGKSKKIFYAGNGVGTTAHFQTLLLKRAGLNFEDVMFDGIAPAQAAVLGGHADFLIATVSNTLRNQNEVTPLCVIADSRDPGLPNLPSIKELGHSVPMLPLGMGMASSPKLPADIVKVLEEANAKAMKDPEMEKFFKENAAVPYMKNHKEWTEAFDKEYATYEAVVKEFGKDLKVT